MIAIYALGPCALIFASLLALCLLCNTNSTGRLARESLVWSLLVAAVVIVLLLSVAGAMTFAMGLVGGLALWFVFLMIVVMAVQRFRNEERRSLMWYLTLAAERGIPLDAAANAFGRERPGVVGQRARSLAGYLEAGIPLSLALKRSHNTLPGEALLAADMGQHTGNLGVGFRQASDQLDTLDDTLRSAIDRLFYVAILVLTISAVMSFVLQTIVPVYAMIFDEFALELPETTVQLMIIADIAQTESLAAALYGLAVTLLVVSAFALGILYYSGVPLHHLPGIGLLWWPADCAMVMRRLAVDVRRQRPIRETVRLLASYFPQHRMRTRLAYAALRIEQGSDWCESLQRFRILRRPECVVFRAAEPAGNLAWALDEMAESSVRRAAYRLTLLLNTLFPLIVVAVGSVLLFISLAMILPLIELIHSLA